MQHLGARHSRPPPVVRAATGAGPAPVGPEPALLALQRAAGNAAVCGLLQRETAAPTAPRAPEQAGDASFDRLIEEGSDRGIRMTKDFHGASPRQRVKLIEIMLDQTWVATDDERAIERIWDGWGPSGIADAYSANRALWDASVDRGADLEEIPAVQPIRRAFERDVKALAEHYLKANAAKVWEEAERLGLGARLGVDRVGSSPVTPQTTRHEATPDAERVIEVQQLAREIQRAEEVMAALGTIPVGYTDDWYESSGRSMRKKTRVQHFVPGFKPTRGPSPFDEGFAEYDEVMRFYQPVKVAHALLLSKNPALFAAAAGKPGEAGRVAAMPPEAAADRLRELMSNTLVKIAQTREMLDTDDLDWRDLIPIQQQLYAGKPSASGIAWDQRFNRQVAVDVIGDYQARQFWIQLGLATLGAAAFVFSAMATGGMATALWAAGGIAAGGVQAGLSIERYDDLATAAQTAVSEETRLVSPQQVRDAKVAAIVDTAFAFLDTLQAVKGIATAQRAVAAREALAKLEQGGAKAAIEQGVDVLGAHETIRRSGRTVDDLIEIVGEDSVAAQRLRAAAADVTVAGRAAEAAATTISPEAAALVTNAHEVFDQWAGFRSPIARLNALLHPVNERLAALGAPPIRGVTYNQAGGLMNYTHWELAADGAKLAAAKISPEDFAQLVNTIAHEARHAEQWFRFAQVEAAAGRTAPQIAAKLGIFDEVAEAAFDVEHGLRSGTRVAGSAGEAQIRALHDAVYGAGQANRVQTLTNLNNASAWYWVRYSQWQAVQHLPIGDVTRVGAERALYQSMVDVGAANRAYRRLPEEIEAWRVGGTAGGAMAERLRAAKVIAAAERVQKEAWEAHEAVQLTVMAALARPGTVVAYADILAFHETMERYRRAIDGLTTADGEARAASGEAPVRPR